MRRDRILVALSGGRVTAPGNEPQGPDGLCDTLIENAALMTEICLKVEYGDYLAISLAKLKERKFEGFQWKIHPKLSWVDVGRLLKKEKAEMDRYLCSTNLPRPETPWLDDVNKAAQILGISEEQLIYEITWYGKRNEFCHLGIKKMILRNKPQRRGKRPMPDHVWSS